MLDTVGDWADQRPDVRPGGWAFQYANPHYPDLDDTAVVVMAMDRIARRRQSQDELPTSAKPIARGREWVLGMQSANGGWGAFDADNTSEYLNHIPFADHGALLDPPTADVTARCVSMIAQLGDHAATSRRWQRRSRSCVGRQEADGSWYGRWGMNYIYGTWSRAVRVERRRRQSRSRRRCVARSTGSIAMQNADGGWGEHGRQLRARSPRRQARRRARRRRRRGRCSD